MSDNRFFRANSKPQARVVVTGLGSLSPIGNNVKESFESAIHGRSGIAKITSFDPENFAAQIAGEVKNFDPSSVLDTKELKKMDRFIQFAMLASDEALKDSGLEVTEQNAERIGCFIGVGMGGLPKIQEQHDVFLKRGPGRISPFFIPMVISNLAPGHVSMRYGLKGPNLTHTSACASGAHAIGEAYNYIKNGHADAMIAGGSESVVCEMAIGGFSAMKALSTRNSTPSEASRPFDKDRDGFVLGEGAGILVLESLESAERRGAKIYAEVRGFGSTSDAHHMTNPAPEGAGGMRAMKMALEDAELNPEEIDYINAHGTSTPVGDGLESKAVMNLFGEHAKDSLWVSSTKSMTGHLLGAAGSLESVFCVKAIESSIVPPTINLENPSEDCPLDYVALTARERKLKAVLNNSFGFGGTNASLIFTSVE
ncbi:MAG: beta-ketoacyl-ACP synthase II [Bdellovibrionota bacterium]